MHSEMQKKKPPLSTTTNQTFGSSKQLHRSTQNTATGTKASQQELLKPRSIIPDNMVYMKRSSSARGGFQDQFNPFSSRNGLSSEKRPMANAYGTTEDQSAFDESVF